MEYYLLFWANLVQFLCVLIFTFEVRDKMLLDLNEEYQIKKGKIGVMLTEDKEEVPSISFLGFFFFFRISL